MAKKSIPQKPSRKLLSLDLSPKPELSKGLEEVAQKNDLPISIAARMCLEIGLPIVKARLKAITEPSLPA